MLDYFSLYDLETGHIYFIPNTILDSHNTSLVLRLNSTRNNQEKGINFAQNYLPDRFLRDFTQDILTDNAEDDDKVQTAT